jgi:hypothetical protein
MQDPNRHMPWTGASRHELDVLLTGEPAPVANAANAAAAIFHSINRLS